MFSRSEVEAAWETVLDHDRRAEIPDVIGWRDRYVAALRGEAVAPLPPTAYLVPRKQPGSLRTIDVLDPAEHARYVAAVARVAGSIERSLRPGVTAHRVAGGAPGQWLERWGRARAKHRVMVRRLLTGRPRAVAVADVRDCFSRLRPDAIVAALRRLGAPRFHLATLHAVAARSDDGAPGLPVGPEPSGVLANAVLALADEAVASEGVRHVRWVDDFTIVVRDAAAASRVLHRLSAALAELGLEPAPEKCRIAEGDEADRFLGRVAAGWSGPGRSRPHASAVYPEDLFAELEALRDARVDPAMADRIRAVEGRRWGREEAKLLGSIADDPDRSAPVRAWAWRALSLTDPGRCVERAAELPDDGDPWVQRAVVAAVGFAGGARARGVLRALRVRVPQAAATAAWGLER